MIATIETFCVAMIFNAVAREDAPTPQVLFINCADIILVKGNPTRDASVLLDHETSIDLVIKDSTIYRNELKK